MIDESVDGEHTAVLVEIEHLFEAGRLNEILDLTVARFVGILRFHSTDERISLRTLEYQETVEAIVAWEDEDRLVIVLFRHYHSHRSRHRVHRIGHRHRQAVL